MNIKIKYIYKWLLPPPLINNNSQFKLATVINIYYNDGIEKILKELGCEFTDDRWEIYRNYELHASYLNFHKLK